MIRKKWKGPAILLGLFVYAATANLGIGTST